MWHHHEEVKQLIHVHYMGLTTSVVLLREGVKYHQKCKVFESYMTLQRCLSSAVTRHWPPLKFTQKNELKNSLLNKLEFIWPIRRRFQFSFSSGCYKTVHKLTMNKIFWNTVRNLSVFLCLQTKRGESFYNIWQEFYGAQLAASSASSSARVKTRQAKWQRPPVK